MAGRRCVTCAHPARKTVDRLIVARTPLRAIAKRFGLTVASVQRHSEKCLPAALVLATHAADVAHGSTLLDELRSLLGEAKGQLEQAKRDGDTRTALQGVSTAARCVELMAKMQGEMPDAGRPVEYTRILTFVTSHADAPFKRAFAAFLHAGAVE